MVLLLFAVFDALVTRAVRTTTAFRTRCCRFELLMGIYIYIIHLYLFDYAYWFNEFETVAPFNLTDDNEIVCVFDEIPTTLSSSRSFSCSDTIPGCRRRALGKRVIDPFFYAASVFRFESRTDERGATVRGDARSAGP